LVKIREKFLKIWAKSLEIWAKSLKYEQKWSPTCFDLKKWSHEECFFGGHPKYGLHTQKVAKYFSGKFEEIWAKILRTPKNLPAPTPMFSIIGPAFSARLPAFSSFPLPIFLFSFHMQLWIRHISLKLLPCWILVCGMPHHLTSMAYSF